MTMRTLVGTIALVLAVLAGLLAAVYLVEPAWPQEAGAPAAERPAPRTDLAEIDGEVMCPVCGTTLELASEAPQAERMRVFIRALIAEGRTKDEIKDRLVAEFGPEVLALPEGQGFDLAAWLVPGGAILLAAIAIGVGLRRWRRSGGSAEPAGDTAPDSADAERLDRDLARYDL